MVKNCKTINILDIDMDPFSIMYKRLDSILGALARTTNDLTLAHARIAERDARIALCDAKIAELTEKLDTARARIEMDQYKKD